MINARLNGVLTLVLGFVGSEGGPIRAICVDPLTGKATGQLLHTLVFEPQELQGLNPEPIIFDKKLPEFEDKQTRTPWDFNKEKNGKRNKR